MATFTIDSDNNIAAQTGTLAVNDNLQSFATEKELTKLAAEWPATRLAEVWNSFAGVTPFDDLKPVTKFKDRKSGAARIWLAIQRLAPEGAQPVAAVAPEKGKAKKAAAKAKKRDAATKGANVERSNKKAEVIAMMKRAKGVTLAEIMDATGWQKHTVRGFVSILGSKGRREG